MVGTPPDRNPVDTSPGSDLRIADCGFRIKSEPQGPRTKGQGSKIKGQRSKIKDQRPKIKGYFLFFFFGFFGPAIKPIGFAGGSGGSISRSIASNTASNCWSYFCSKPSSFRASP